MPVRLPKPRWTGKSSIDVHNAPVAISELRGSVQPHFKMSGDGTQITVRRTEYVEDIKNTSEDFLLKKYVLTPTNTTLFPWLSGIAARYECYSFNGITIHYCSTSPTSTAGMAGLAVEYDATDNDPVDKHQFLNICPAERASVWSAQSLHLTKQDLNILTGENGMRFCGDPMDNDTLGTMAMDGDAHTTLAGRVFMMMQDVDRVGTAGEMWVEYSVNLGVPDYAPACNVPLPLSVHGRGSDTSQFSYSDGWFGSLTTIAAGTNQTRGLVGIEIGVNTLTFKLPGKYYYLRMRSECLAGALLSDSVVGGWVWSGAGGHTTLYQTKILRNQNSLASTTAFEWFIAVKTNTVADGGPVPDAPSVMTWDLITPGIVAAGNYMKESSLFGFEVARDDYTYGLGSLDCEEEVDADDGKQASDPPDTEDCPPSGLSTPGSGWVMARASQVLGYADDSKVRLL